MAKYKGEFFLQVDRGVFNSDYKCLTPTACKVYFMLCELEHRFCTGDGSDFFFRTNEDLAEDTGLNVSTVKKAKKELREKGYIATHLVHFRDVTTGTRSKKKETGYRILKRGE